MMAAMALHTSLAQRGQQFHLQPSEWRSGQPIDLPAELTDGPFVALSLSWPADHPGQWLVHLRLPAGEEQVMALRRDPHATATGRYVSSLAYAPSGVDAVWLQFVADDPAHSEPPVMLRVYNPGHSQPGPWRPHAPVEERNACPCPQPSYLDREGWCPGGSCPTDPTPVPTVVTHLIVHHSAGPNSSSDWAAVVRSIWDFHVNVNGWDDIGYNWLIDPNGVLYEGRGDGLLGAHFCGTNGGTMGVCMLGNFTDVVPQQAALTTLEQLLAWKSCDASLDPLGTAFHASSGLNLHRISGHRDGCTTECPGNAFYPLLPQLRQDVQNRIDGDCSAAPQPPNAPTLLSATVIDPHRVLLTWNDNADNETGYRLERSASNNTSYSQLAALPANTVAFDDLTVSPSTGYYYRVRALGNGSMSDYSNEVFVFTGASADREARPAAVVELYPNPTTGVLHLQLHGVPAGEPVHLALFDAFQRQIFEETQIGHSHQIDLSDLPAGLYSLRLAIGQAVLFKTIIKTSR